MNPIFLSCRECKFSRDRDAGQFFCAPPTRPTVIRWKSGGDPDWLMVAGGCDMARERAPEHVRAWQV